MSKELHIVCHDMPWPGDNDNAMDMLNRIRSFHKIGVQIHLHYFGSDISGPCQLNTLCKTVKAYPRKSLRESFSTKMPCFVSSRMNEELISDLNKDEHPVLLDGLHTTGILKAIHNGSRKICVRLHNNETVYHRSLARRTFDPLKKIYYTAESILTGKYTSTLPKNITYACISGCDWEYMVQSGFSRAFHIPAFGNWQNVNSPTGIGNLCLFHGNFSVAENEKAAMWLLCNVFNNVRVPFVIAGKNPSRRLRKAATLCQHTCLVSDPSKQELNDLIQKAHINILPFLNKNTTGMRLKLLHALFEGRHCVVNPAMVSGTGLEAACHIGHNSRSIAGIISELYTQPFVKDDIDTRQRLLYEHYNNDKNIQRFKDLLW